MDLLNELEEPSKKESDLIKDLKTKECKDFIMKKYISNIPNKTNNKNI